MPAPTSENEVSEQRRRAADGGASQRQFDVVTNVRSDAVEERPHHGPEYGSDPAKRQDLIHEQDRRGDHDE